MKYIIVIGDGMADNPVPELGDKTPLEVAQHLLMDDLAQKGELGSVRTVPEGVVPGSDTAILSIFGYDPRQYYSGRSPLEAAGSGVTLAAGDVSYRCNMVALSDDEVPYAQKTILSHSGGSVDGETALALMDSLTADERFAKLAAQYGMTFYPSPSFRHIAVQKGAAIDGLLAAPPHDHLGEGIAPLLPTGCETAKGLCEMMELAHEILDKHPLNEKRRAAGKLPANGIWFWAEGVALQLPPFAEKLAGKGMVVSAVPLVRGIGALAGLGYVEVEGATGELDTNFEGKAEAMLKALADGADFVVGHIEAPDECTHNGDTPGKLQAIEWLDSRFLKPLLDGLAQSGEDYRLLILSDHKTLTATRGHDGDPVPYLLYDSTAPQKGGARYTEALAEEGLCLEEGCRLIDRLLQKK